MWQCAPARSLCRRFWLAALPVRAYFPLGRTPIPFQKVRSCAGGGTEAEREALTKANEFCTQQGRKFVPSMMGDAAHTVGPYGPTGYTVTFRCLLPDDPAIAAYQLQQAPNVIVEQRNR
jgi:hypothetical protein